MSLDPRTGIWKNKRSGKELECRFSSDGFVYITYVKRAGPPERRKTNMEEFLDKYQRVRDLPD